MNDTQTVSGEKIRGGGALLLLAILFAAMSALCYQAYQHHTAMWANDSQLGALKTSSSLLPADFTGEWVDQWWIGSEVPAPSPSVTLLLATMISPEMYLKIYTPFTMLLLGFCAWVLFRQLKFAPMVCVLGALGAGLNMHCFSNACWGLGTWNVSIAMIFLALAALLTDSIRQTWIKAILAGLATGMAVMEGFDSGAILSVYVGVFIVFLCFITQSGVPRKIIQCLGVGGLVVLFAGLIAASTLYTLVGTQIYGISGGGQSPAEKKFAWDFATEWSLPKLESLKVIIPGVFGYRMEEFMTSRDKSAAYWGKVGEDPHIAEMESGNPEVRAASVKSLGASEEIVNLMRGDNPDAHAQILDQVKQGLQRRHSGNGEYAGVLVALFALFGVLNSWRGRASPFTRRERLIVWFMAFAALFTLVAAWGRFAFLYQWIYLLPMVDKIRNPIKYMHAFHLSWIILAGFGMEAFHRSYLQVPADESASGKVLESKSWWRKLSGFDKNYLVGLLLAAGLAVAGYLIYAGYKPDLTQYLTHQGFDAELAAKIAAFSVNETAWFVGILLLSALVILSSLAGLWAGRRACWAWAVLCAIMVFDIARADLPWVRYFNYDQKYSMNEVTKVLLDKPYEHRVVGRLSPRGGYDLPGNGNFSGVIHWWIENDFPYHDIQSLEIDQMPRMPVIEGNYLGLFYPRAPEDFAPAERLWKLTNTRYLLADASFLDGLNNAAGPGRRPFHYVFRFNLVPKPGITNAEDVQDAGDLTTQVSDQGREALIEYTDTLPRAKLYSRWLTTTNDEGTLLKLVNPEWDPAQSVIVSAPTNGVPLPSSSAAPNADPGAVQITHYSPKDVQLQASAKTPAVLLYNDRTAAAWHVWVDDKPADLLHCNYIMRGVFLPPGDHTIEFKYIPSSIPLCITLAAWLCGLLLLSYVFWPGSAAKPAPQPA